MEGKDDSQWDSKSIVCKNVDDITNSLLSKTSKHAQKDGLPKVKNKQGEISIKNFFSQLLNFLIFCKDIKDLLLEEPEDGSLYHVN